MIYTADYCSSYCLFSCPGKGAYIFVKPKKDVVSPCYCNQIATRKLRWDFGIVFLIKTRHTLIVDVKLAMLS
jgi:hypothetical protein